MYGPDHFAHLSTDNLQTLVDEAKKIRQRRKLPGINKLMGIAMLVSADVELSRRAREKLIAQANNERNFEAGLF